MSAIQNELNRRYNNKKICSASARYVLIQGDSMYCNCFVVKRQKHFFIDLIVAYFISTFVMVCWFLLEVCCTDHCVNDDHVEMRASSFLTENHSSL